MTLPGKIRGWTNQWLEPFNLRIESRTAERVEIARLLNLENRHHELDIRDRHAVLAALESLRPTLVVHTAAQPSHDLAASRPFDDFDVNAVGTLNLLEATRQHTPNAVFVHMSTNKVIR